MTSSVKYKPHVRLCRVRSLTLWGLFRTRESLKPHALAAEVSALSNIVRLRKQIRGARR